MYTYDEVLEVECQYMRKIQRQRFWKDEARHEFVVRSFPPLRWLCFRGCGCYHISQTSALYTLRSDWFVVMPIVHARLTLCLVSVSLIKQEYFLRHSSHHFRTPARRQENARFHSHSSDSRHVVRKWLKTISQIVVRCHFCINMFSCNRRITKLVIQYRDAPRRISRSLWGEEHVCRRDDMVQEFNVIPSNSLMFTTQLRDRLDCLCEAANHLWTVSSDAL